MLYHNIIRSDDQRVIKEIISIQQRTARETTWYASVRRAVNYYGITLVAEESLKSTWKKHVKKKIKEKTAAEIKEECSKKTKSRTVKDDVYRQKKYIVKCSITYYYYYYY